MFQGIRDIKHDAKRTAYKRHAFSHYASYLREEARHRNFSPRELLFLNLMISFLDRHMGDRIDVATVRAIEDTVELLSSQIVETSKYLDSLMLNQKLERFPKRLREDDEFDHYAILKDDGFIYYAIYNYIAEIKDGLFRIPELLRNTTTDSFRVSTYEYFKYFVDSFEVLTPEEGRSTSPLYLSVLYYVEFYYVRTGRHAMELAYDPTI